MIFEYLIIFATLTLSGVVKGVLGAGLPVVAVPVLASFFDVPFAIAMMMVPTVVTNVWQMWQFRHERAGFGWLWSLCLLASIGIVAGTWLLASLPADVLGVTLAIAVVAYIVLRLARPHWHISMAIAKPLAPVVGFLSGLLQGATGISAPVSITFLSSIGLSRTGFVFAISALFLSFSAAQIPSLAVAGILTWERLLLSTLALVPVLIGMPLGGWLASRMSREAFNRLVLVLLAVIAAKLVYDAFT